MKRREAVEELVCQDGGCAVGAEIGRDGMQYVVLANEKQCRDWLKFQEAYITPGTHPDFIRFEDAERELKNENYQAC